MPTSIMAGPVCSISITIMSNFIYLSNYFFNFVLIDYPAVLASRYSSINKNFVRMNSTF